MWEVVGSWLFGRGSGSSAWVGCQVPSSPVLSQDGGTVYFGSDDHKLYALHTANDTLQWSYTTGNWVSVGHGCGRLWGLVVWGSGSGAWVGFQVYSRPVLSQDGSTVYFGSLDNKLYALHTANGTLQWSYTADNGVSVCHGCGRLLGWLFRVWEWQRCMGWVPGVFEPSAEPGRRHSVLWVAK